jgi:flagellar protein FlaG
MDIDGGIGRTGPAYPSGTTIRQGEGIERVLKLNDERDLKNAELQGANIPISEEQLIRTIAKSLKILEGPQTSFDISVHEKTKNIMVKVLNRENGEVIREIPPEKILDMVANMMEVAGVIINKRV